MGLLPFASSLHSCYGWFKPKDQRGWVYGYIQGTQFRSQHDYYTLVFFDDVLTLGLVSWKQWVALHSIPMRYEEALGLVFNGINSILLFSNREREDIEYIARISHVEI